MKYQISTILLFFQSIVFFSPGYGQGTLQDYKRAEKYLPFNVNKLVLNTEVNPVWTDDGFLYKKEHYGGHMFIRVTNKNGKQTPAFDHDQLSELLKHQTGINIRSDSLPLSNLQLKDNCFQFHLNEINWIYCHRRKSLEKYNEPKKEAKNESVSPDGKWMVSVESYNIWLTNKESGEKNALTSDGVEKYEYATPHPWLKTTELEKGDVYDPAIYVNWSDDSRKFVTYKMDRRNMKPLYLYQSLPDSGMRARVWYYDRPLPGENTTKLLEFYVFDVSQKSGTRIQIDPYTDFLTNVYPGWIGGSEKLYMSHISRGYKDIQSYIVDASTGKADTIVHEKAKTMIEYQMAFSQVSKDNRFLIWSSERNGWNHLYLYDLEKRALVRQLTHGEYVVRSIIHVDEKNIWFIAGGKEPGQDPYYRHLYKTDFLGSELVLLTPENADHDIRLSTDKKFFLDNVSRIDMPTVTNLRSMDNGRLISLIQKADINPLLSIGYKMPEPFTVKCRYGITDIYGAVFYPSNFDPTIKYPIIDATYSGPQAVKTPKSFVSGYRNLEQPIAELGFIVVTVDGLGTAMRSKEFHDFSYMNLGDIGSDDHITAILQLARQRSYMDTTRIGIYGHSAGGYDAARALLIRPDFYKVGVSSAGNHDFRMSKAWWDEQYMGLPGDHYIEQSNLTWAPKLTGKLLLMTGDMDQNVNPANTLRLAAELVKHNRDFDLFLLPNADHNISNHPYVLRRRWDYFVKHLLEVEPPENYLIRVPD